MHIALQVFRGELLQTLEGSAWLVWYFRLLGSNIGCAVCLFPTGSDPMMTEPDLVSIGDSACINHAFVVCHTNTKVGAVHPLQQGCM